MSDQSQGPGWWQASDDKWYAPEQAPGPDPTTGGTWTPPADPGWGAPAPQAPPAWGQSPTWNQPPTWGSAPTPGYGGGYAPQGGYAYGGSGLPSVSGQATASMVLGILALVLCLCWILAIPLAVIGLPLGLVALNKINKGEASADGKGMATAGVVLCGIALVLGIGIGVLIFAS